MSMRKHSYQYHTFVKGRPTFFHPLVFFFQPLLNFYEHFLKKLLRTTDNKKFIILDN